MKILLGTLCIAGFAALPAAESAKSTTIGVAHVAGLYHFTGQHFLDEGAAEIEKLGAKCIKVYLTLDTDRPAKECYPFGSDWPECRTLKELAASAPFQRLFARPFETYVLTSFRAGKPAGYWREAFTQDDAAAEEEEFYQLARFLLRAYSGTGKTFILQNWEGDWAVRDGFDAKADPKPAVLARMTQWLQARQRGVERARRDESAEGVTVLHAVEVCLLRGGMDEGRPCVANRVLPKVAPDLVSYSCWELQKDPALLRRGLDWLATQTPARPPFGSRNIIIGEFGSPENTFPPDKQRAMIEGTLRVARDFGCPLAIYWQVFCNEAVHRPVKSNKDVRGFSLVRPDGTHTLARELLKHAIH